MSVWNNWNNAESEDRLALVFENRNRAYGAYVIRREYDRSMVLACLLGLGITVLLVCIPMWAGREIIPRVVRIPEPKIETIDIPKEANPVKPEIQTSRTQAAQGPPTMAGIPNLNPALSPHLTPPNWNPGGGRPGQTGLAGMAPGLGDRPGFHNAHSPLLHNGELTGAQIEAMPKCGMPTFREQMRDRIFIPEGCLYNTDDLQVVLMFIVDVKGKISNVKIIKDSPCPGFGDAAVKVLEGYENWIPGQSNGRFVNSYRTIPFELSVR